MDPGATRRDQDDAALPGDDERGGVEEGRDPERGRSSGTGAEAELEGDLRTLRADHAVDLVRGDAGVGECPEGPDQRDRGRVVIGQGARLHRVVDAGDGHVTKGVWRMTAHGRLLSVPGRGSPGFMQGSLHDSSRRILSHRAPPSAPTPARPGGTSLRKRRGRQGGWGKSWTSRWRVADALEIDACARCSWPASRWPSRSCPARPGPPCRIRAHISPGRPAQGVGLPLWNDAGPAGLSTSLAGNDAAWR